VTGKRADQSDLESLLARVNAALGKHVGPAPGSRSIGTLGLSRVIPETDAVFYRMGIADAAEGGRAAVCSLRLDGMGASPRTFLVAVFRSRGKLVLASRWIPREDRPLLARGDADAARWPEAALEAALEARIVAGRGAFEDDLARGRGHVDSSQDMLGLQGG
jgi:hypothetical protein